MFLTTLIRILATDDVGAFLDAHRPFDFQTKRAVKLQCPAAGGGFGIADEHADLFPDLVDEDKRGFGAGDDGGQFAQRLAHQPGLQSHVGVAHVSLQFRLRDQRGYAVHDDNIDSARAHQDFGDFQRLFAVIGLGDVEFIDVHAQFLSIGGIKSMFGVDESGISPRFLSLGNAVQRQRGFARSLVAVDFA